MCSFVATYLARHSVTVLTKKYLAVIFTRIKDENTSNVLKLRILSNFGGAYHTLRGTKYVTGIRVC
jgi:hypothetical protein